VKADLFRDMGGLSAGGILAPLLGQIQVTVDQAMAQGGDVGEKDADLAVVDAAGGPAILGLDTSGVRAAFGKAAFIQDQKGEERIGCSRSGRRRQQGLDQGRA
jgi:hypothetical protein